MVRRSAIFIVLVTILVLYGLVCMYSASSYEAIKEGLEASYYFKRQAVFALLGLAASIVIIVVPERLIRLFIIPLLALCLVLMLMTLFTSYGQTILGARRWLKLGPLPQFQPSELVKLSTILFLAWYFSKCPEKLRLRDYAITVAAVGSFALLILAQKDFSTSIIYLGTCLGMMMLGGFDFKWTGLIIGASIVPLLLFIALKPFRILRIASFLFPDLDPSGINYQVTNAKAAISRGLFLGSGIGKGTGKLGSIPEVQSDFIFASIAEETGLLGIILICSAFLAFAFLGFSASRRQLERNRFYSYMCYGFTFMVIFQAIVNIAVVTGLLPPTGIPLPFFSQGGTNLLVVIMESAMIAKVMRDSERGESL